MLQDYFGGAKTADRIYDFVGKLARKAGIENGSDGFKDMLKQARKGVEQGFEAVQQALGELPEVSKQTRAVLDRMFEQAQSDPAGPRPHASNILEQLLAERREDQEDDTPLSS